MKVAQRETSVTGLTDGSDRYQTVDRFRFVDQGTPTYVFTMSQSTDAPVGFSKSLKLNCSTAQTSLGVTDALSVDQYIEAQNVQQLNYGTSDAKAITLSFWVKSNKVGNYAVYFLSYDSSRSCTHSYTINAQDTWEYKTITVAGDTVGVIDDDNDRGLVVRWYLAAGTDYTSGTASTTYQAQVSANIAAGFNINLADSTSNNWQITGVQLEVGSAATPFEYESYGQTLAKCQRYFFRNPDAIWSSNYGSNAMAHVFMPVTMRATPNTFVYGHSGGGGAFSSNSLSPHYCRAFYTNNNTYAITDIKIDAEL